MKKKKYLKILLGGLFALAFLATILMVFSFVENIRGRRALQSFKQEWKQMGVNLEWESIIPPKVPDDQNVAMIPLFAPLLDFHAGTQKRKDTNLVSLLENWPPRFAAARQEVSRRRPFVNSWLSEVDLVKWHNAFLETSSAGKAAMDLKGPANAVQETNIPLQIAASSVLDGLSDAEQELKNLRTAIQQRPHSRFNIAYDYQEPAAILLPHLNPLRTISSVLELRCAAQLELGQNGQAFEDVMLLLHLPELTSNEPLLISYLVRSAQHTLALNGMHMGIEKGKWNDDQLAKFQEKLAGLNLLEEGRKAVRGEQMFGYRIIDCLKRYKGSLNDMLPMDSNLPNVRFLPSGWFDFESKNLLQIYQEVILPCIDIESRRMDPKEFKAAETTIEKMLKSPRWKLFLIEHRFFAAMVMPAITPAGKRIAGGQVATDLAYLACALERHRLANGGYPKNLDELVPKFAQKIPKDVLTGDRPVYRVEGESYKLYSMGWNLVDDNGTMEKGKSREPLMEKGDWVWK